MPHRPSIPARANLWRTDPKLEIYQRAVGARAAAHAKRERGAAVTSTTGGVSEGKELGSSWDAEIAIWMRRLDTERMEFLSVFAKKSAVIVREDWEAMSSRTVRSRKRGGNTVSMEICTVGWEFEMFCRYHNEQ